MRRAFAARLFSRPLHSGLAVALLASLVVSHATPTRAQNEIVVDFMGESRDILSRAGLTLIGGASLRIEPTARSNIVMPPELDRVGFFLGPGDLTSPQARPHCTVATVSGPGLRAFGVTRPGVRNQSSTPAWQIRAFNRAGAQVGNAIGEGPMPNAGYFGFPVEPADFTIVGAGITSLEICSHNTLSTFGAIPLARLRLTPDAAPIPPTPVISRTAGACPTITTTGCPIELDEPVAAVLDNPSDAHLWRITIRQAGSMNAIVATLPGRYRIYIYGPDQALVAVLTNDGPDPDEVQISTSSAVGPHTIVIDIPEGQGTSVPYTLRATTEQL